MVANFDVFKFNRQAKEVLILSISGDYPNDADVDFKEIARVLRFLYPDSAGVRITIL